MNKTVINTFILTAVLCLLFSGCNNTAKKKGASSAVESTALATAPPILDLDISRLVTSEQVGNALGIAVGEAQLADENTTARYYSSDSMSYLEISIMKCSKEEYDQTVALYSNAADTLNLGNAAKWSAESKQLLVYNGEYMIGIIAYITDKSNDDLLLSARQVAALVLEKL